MSESANSNGCSSSRSGSVASRGSSNNKRHWGGGKPSVIGSRTQMLRMERTTAGLYLLMRVWPISRGRPGTSQQSHQPVLPGSTVSLAHPPAPNRCSSVVVGTHVAAAQSCRPQWSRLPGHLKATSRPHRSGLVACSKHGSLSHTHGAAPAAMSGLRSLQRWLRKGCDWIRRPLVASHCISIQSWEAQAHASVLPGR